MRYLVPTVTWCEGDLGAIITEELVEQIRDLADDRLVYGCIYCGGPEETRDHVPSRILLDKPFPEQLPVVGCCLVCNNGFSLDEEYFACVIEAVICGAPDPDRIGRTNIAEILRRKPALRKRIESARIVKNGQIHFEIDSERFKNVILKLAKGHMAYENSQVFDEPPTIRWSPLALLSPEERETFDSPHPIELFGELGSRASQRFSVMQLTLRSLDGKEIKLDRFAYDWIDVQDGRYRYLAIDDGDTKKVKIVISVSVLSPPL